MPATKKQIKRIEILDELLAHRKYPLEELLRHINDRISDGEEFINKRTLFRDINYLIDEENAPVHRPEKGDPRYYYTGRFSLKALPLDEEDVAYLRKAAEILKQVENFKVLEEVEAIVNKLENRIYTERFTEASAVQFEKHTASAGQEFFDDLYDAIVSKVPLKITYQPYQQAPAEKMVHPYLLKEFRNRWFLLGREDGMYRLSTYALDRIRKIRNSGLPFLENDLFNPDTYFNHLIGVSAPYGAVPDKIQIKVFKELAPYIKSKPIHHNQIILREFKDRSLLIQLELIINYELKSTLLSYGAGLKVKGPMLLKLGIRELVQQMSSLY